MRPPEPFSVAVQTGSNGLVTVVTVAAGGEFDVAVAATFDAVTNRVLDIGPSRVVVDLTAVTLLDSAGIGAIMRLRRAVAETDAGFSICAPEPFQQRLFAVTGLSHLLD